MENKSMDLDMRIKKLTDEDAGLEYEESEAEREEPVTEEVGEIPFDAEKIRIDQQMLSLKYISELMDTDMIDTNPDFQRKPVWKDNKRKSLLIESLMLRIPIPALYFYENEDSKFQVIDGQQRLTTIREFLKDGFHLTGLEYLKDDCDKKVFSNLDIKYQQRIYRTQMAVNILDARSPKHVIYDIFRRVNTGGIPLNPQEMRNAICKVKAREFLKRGTKLESYLKATRGRIKDDRMDSQEMILRFFAFYEDYNFQQKIINYRYNGIAEMLDAAMELLNLMTEEEMERMERIFDEAMKRSYDMFGQYSFSKVQLDPDTKAVGRKLDYINKSLFASFSVILSDPKYDGVDLKDYRNVALRKLAAKLEEKRDYFNSITMGTGDKKRVEDNFRFSNEVIDECNITV